VTYESRVIKRVITCDVAKMCQKEDSDLVYFILTNLL